MAIICPFPALRPTPAGASSVAAVPYDVVSTEEARALSAGNPLSFLHVSRAEIGLTSVDPYAEEVYEAAARNFETLRREAPLVLDAVPSLYFYRLALGSHEQTGLAGCYSLDEYDRNIIRKHERTRRDKEDDRTRHMIALGAQTGPVFLTYRASEVIDAAAARASAAAPLFDFTAPDEVRHTVWRVSGADLALIVEAVHRLPVLYIADGHHRAASAARARDYFRAQPRSASATASDPPGARPFDTVLAVAFPHNQTQILPYNRIVKDLGGLSAEAFLARVASRCTMTDGPGTPARKGQVAMYLGGKWRTLVFNHASRSSAGTIDSLDVSVLQERLLEPVLEIADVRTDKRIDFVGGGRGSGELERLVDAGRAAVAFSLFPVSVNDLMAIADAGEVMPPKSTWFEPKLRDGLLIHEI